MSNLKHRSEEQLLEAKRECERYMGNLKRLLGGQATRLIWINKYIKDKARIEIKYITPEQALTWLIHNDVECRPMWEGREVNGDLVHAVSENLRDFGYANQSGPVIVAEEEE